MVFFDRSHNAPSRAHVGSEAAAAARSVGGVNVFLKKFTKLGYIEYNDGLKVNESLDRVILRDKRVPTRKFKTG